MMTEETCIGNPSIGIKGKIVTIKVEVVDTKLDYNLLLGGSWTYVVSAVVSSLFCMIQFPHRGKIVKIN